MDALAGTILKWVLEKYTVLKQILRNPFEMANLFCNLGRHFRYKVKKRSKAEKGGRECAHYSVFLF